jgi:diguanylate cyclase (GGDEF)-like protein
MVRAADSVGAFTDSTIELLLRAAEPIGRRGGVLLGIALIAAIGIADYALGPSVQLTAIYSFGPIATAWCATRRDAIGVAGVAALVGTGVHWATGSLVSEPTPLLLTLFFRFSALAVIAALVSQVRTTTERLEALSMRDELTGLLNRRALVERLEEEISRAERQETPLSLIYADVDEFKKVNDHFGHSVGDEYLIQAGETLTAMLRPTDHVARMGGDEFVVVLPETDSAGAEALAARISEGLLELNRRYGTGMSLGITSFASAPESVEAAISAGDHQMYAAKRARKATRATD